MKEANGRGDFTNEVDDAAFSGVDNYDRLTEIEPMACIDVRDLITMQMPESAFVVEHLFPQGAVVLFSGDSGSCKTAFMLHACFAIAFSKSVGGRFVTMPAAGPILYLNGELDPALLQQSIMQAAAGFAVQARDLRAGGFVLAGDDGFTTVRFRADSVDQLERDQLEKRISASRPSIVVMDTLRAIFDLDEKEATQVRSAFAWLKSVASKYRCCIVVPHHLRKVGAQNNGERERVSGSRDLIAAVDVHIQAKSHNGRPMHALYVDKTRYPKDSVRAGVEFPVESRFEPPTSAGAVGLSTFAVGAPTIADAAIETETSHERDILARFEAGSPLTKSDCGAGENDSGAMRRAFRALGKRGRIVKTGSKKPGTRMDLWELAGDRDDLFSGDDSEPGQESGPAAARFAAKTQQKPVVQGIEPGHEPGQRAARKNPRDRPDDADAPAAYSEGAPPSHQAERTGPTGPVHIGRPGSFGPVHDGDAAAVESEAFPV